MSPHHRDGLRGALKLATALIPLSDYKILISKPDLIDFEVQSHGPMPFVNKNGGYNSTFWVERLTDNTKYEILTPMWENHNITTLQIDPGFLMCYGLTPRLTSDIIFWDDLSNPTFDVVKIIPNSYFSSPYEHTHASIVANRIYLEDYLSLKECAAIAVFYEERWSKEEDTINEIIGKDEHVYVSYKSLKIGVQTFDYDDVYKYFINVWGARLITLPNDKRPITEETKPSLIWPDFEEEIDKKQAMIHSFTDRVFISDSFLKRYEDKPGFEINPKSGSITYDSSRWALSYCRRVGRNFISYELRKVYEGIPPFVTRELNRHAVKKSIAVNDSKKYGTDNIGIRAERLIYSFINLVERIIDLSSLLKISIDTNDIIGISRDEIDYYGWWRIERYKRLGNVSPVEMTFNEFMDRIMLLDQISESIKPGRIKNILESLNTPEISKCIHNLKSLKLLSTLIQLADISAQQSLPLTRPLHKEIISHFDCNKTITCISPTFAIHDLRNIHGHSGTKKYDSDLDHYLSYLEINRKEMIKGWGTALDNAYDHLADSFNQMSVIISAANIT